MLNTSTQNIEAEIASLIQQARQYNGIKELLKIYIPVFVILTVILGFFLIEETSLLFFLILILVFL